MESSYGAKQDLLLSTEPSSMAFSNLDRKDGFSEIISGNACDSAKSVEVPLGEALGFVNQDFQSFANALLGYSSVRDSANSNTSLPGISPFACDKDEGKDFSDDSDIYERVFEDRVLVKKWPKILKALSSVGLTPEMAAELVSRSMSCLKVDLYKEASTLYRLCHPFVLDCYGFVIDVVGRSMAMVTEFMIHGSLRNALQKRLIIGKHLQVLILLKVAYGMDYLHRNEVVHYDLKPENVFVNLHFAGKPTCKIGNLGQPKGNSLALLGSDVQGSLPWMAPELFYDGYISEKVDVFSFGIMMWEVLTGQAPYSDMHSEAVTRGIVMDKLRPSVPEYCDPCLKSLMERCWASEPSKRPSFAEIADELCEMEEKLRTSTEECHPTQSKIEK